MLICSTLCACRFDKIIYLLCKKCKYGSQPTLCKILLELEPKFEGGSGKIKLKKILYNLQISTNTNLKYSLPVI